MKRFRNSLLTFSLLLACSNVKNVIDDTIGQIVIENSWANDGRLLHSFERIFTEVTYYFRYIYFCEGMLGIQAG